MLVGATIPCLIGLKLFLLAFYTDRPYWFPEWLWGAHLLGLVGGALAVAAAFELAYMLFTPGPDEAVGPLILGLAATALITVSDDHVGLEAAFVVALLIAGIGSLFWVRDRFLEEDD